MNQPERRDHDRTSFRQTRSCQLKHLASGEVFRADIADLSRKGMRLKFPPEMDIDQVTDSPGNLRILDSTLEKSTFDLTGRTLIVIWQEGLELGCSFVD